VSMGTSWLALLLGMVGVVVLALAGLGLFFLLHLYHSPPYGGPEDG